MRLAMSGDTDEDLKFAVQMGATDIVGGGSLSTDGGHYTVAELRHLRQRVEATGLRLAVVSGPPEQHTYKVKLGLPGRDEQIDNWCTHIRNIGAAGIPAVCYFHSLRSHYGNYGLRTDRAMPVRNTGAPPCRRLRQPTTSRSGTAWPTFSRRSSQLPKRRG